MNEERWLTCPDPVPMLAYLRGKIGPRKVRLWAAGYCRLLGRHLDRSARNAIHVAELLANGRLRAGEVFFACQFALATVGDERLRRALAAMLDPDVVGAAECFVEASLDFAAEVGQERETEAIVQAMVLREVVGNPFRPVTLSGAVSLWQRGAIGNIAEDMYRRRSFTELPVLADALEDAGCVVAPLLEHLRARQRHFIGCWALDVILSRGGEERAAPSWRMAQ